MVKEITRDLTAEEQIQTMHRLKRGAVAWLLGHKSPAALVANAAPDLRRNLDGKTYDAREVMRYHVENRRRRSDRPGDRDRIAKQNDPEQMVLDGLALERKRVLEARKLEIQILELERQVFPIAVADEFFATIVARLKSLGDSLQRQHGREALGLLNEAIDDMTRTVSNWRSSMEGEHVDT